MTRKKHTSAILLTQIIACLSIIIGAVVVTQCQPPDTLFVPLPAETRESNALSIEAHSDNGYTIEVIPPAHLEDVGTLSDPDPDAVSALRDEYTNGSLWQIVDSTGAHITDMQGLIGGARTLETELRAQLRNAEQLERSAFFSEGDKAKSMQDEARRLRSRAWGDYKERLGALVSTYTEG